jgi:hypothetical protein
MDMDGMDVYQIVCPPSEALMTNRVSCFELGEKGDFQLSNSPNSIRIYFQPKKKKKKKKKKILSIGGDETIDVSTL